MALIQSYSETNVNSDVADAKKNDPAVGGTDNSRQGVAILTPASPAYTLTSFKFAMKKVGSPTGNASCQLYAATGSIESATPTGAVLASTTFDVSTLTTSYALYEFTFGTPYAAAANTTYCLVWQNPGSGIDTSNYPIMGVNGSGGNGINQVRYDGSWIANSRSPAYYLYGTAPATGLGWGYSNMGQW